MMKTEPVTLKEIHARRLRDVYRSAGWPCQGVVEVDLLGDLKRPEKRGAYLDVGGQCWYVLGCDGKGKPIAEQHEIPAECGVVVWHGGQFEVTRMAPKRVVIQLPFGVWTALGKATPKRRSDLESPQVKLQMG